MSKLKLKNLLGGKILGVKEDEHVIEMMIVKNGEKYKVRLYPINEYIAYSIYEELR